MDLTVRSFGLPFVHGASPLGFVQLRDIDTRMNNAAFVFDLLYSESSNWVDKSRTSAGKITYDLSVELPATRLRIKWYNRSMAR